MKTAVRYYSKLGNTKRIAEAIAEGAGVKAVSVTEEPDLAEYVDVLFLGGAPYANIMAPELRAYAEKLSADQVGRAVLFTTSNWSRRTVRALKKELRAKGIPVDEKYFYAHMTRIKARTDAAKDFTRKMLE
ncbi:MAG: flavodoxin [Clostridia bacterium]|nr:flavodoxin [Clostridia bacterium]